MVHAAERANQKQAEQEEAEEEEDEEEREGGRDENRDIAKVECPGRPIKVDCQRLARHSKDTQARNLASRWWIPRTVMISTSPRRAPRRY